MSVHFPKTPSTQVLLSIPLLVQSAFAQQDVSYHVRHFTPEDGLSHRQVNAVVQDDKGFLWVGTEAGLDRFDGHEFRNWITREGPGMGPVSRLCIDGEDFLWVIHHGSVDRVLGIHMLELRSGRVTTFEQRFGTAFDPSDFMGEFLADRKGSVTWCTREGELMRYTPGRSIQRWPIHRTGETAVYQGEVHLMDMTPDGHVWGMVKPATLVEISEAGELLREWNYHTGAVRRMFRTKASMVGNSSWFIIDQVGAPSALYRIEPGVGPVQRDTLHDPAFDDYGSCVRVELPNGNHLEHSFVIDPQGKVVFDLATEFPDVRYRLLCGLPGRNGQAWIGGDFGLYMLEVRPDRFQRWLYSEAIPQGYGKRCRGLLEWNGRLLVNTEIEGWYELSSSDGRVLRHEPAWLTGFALIRDRKARIWYGQQEEVVMVDLDGTVRRYDCGWETWTALDDPREGFLLGQREGLMVLDPNTGKCSTYPRYNDQPVLAGAHVLAMERDTNGSIWLCTDRGLFSIRPGEGVKERFWVGGDSLHRLPDDDIRHLVPDAQGIYWLATASSGLVRWDRATGSTRTWTRAQGMPSNTVHGVYKDADGDLWMPTENGIARLDPRTDVITTYTTADGLPHNEFNRISHTRLANGRLCFGGLNGLTVFDPRAFHDTLSDVQEPLVLAGFDQYDARLQRTVDRAHELDSTGIIRVYPGDRTVQIKVALLNFDTPGSTTYAWQVEDHSPGWIEQREQLIRVGDLPYGEWKLRIRARDAGGHWSARELDYTIEVLRPFYLQWWFLLLCLSAFGALVALWSRYRLRRQLEVVAMRDRIAMDLHDEVGGTLSRLALFADTANATDPALKPSTRKLLERISSNSSAALGSMNDIVWAVNAGNDSMPQVIDRMRAVAVQASEAIGCSLFFEVEPAVQRMQLSLEQRRDLYLLYKEAVNNAVKHSGCSALRIRFQREGREMLLSVSDNGKGFVQDGTTAPGRLSGNGSINMQRRAAGLNGKLTVTSAPHAGTQVDLRFQP
ncbi:MAG TPA: two-component regulator propeller domain-containing protein [Flavobacteriales bacterium]